MSNHSSAATGTITRRARPSGSVRASAFGVTSPNASTASVVDADRQAIPLLPKRLTAASVTTAETPMLTSVFPARIAVRTR